MYQRNHSVVFTNASKYYDELVYLGPKKSTYTSNKESQNMNQDRLHGRCHCGTIKFSIPRDLNMGAVRRCDCSLCKRRGAIMLACPIQDVCVESGDEQLIRYKWNTKVATHHFCSKCGIMTHHQRRSTPEVCGVNIGCIDELDYSSFKSVPMNNGVNLTLVD